MISLLYYEHKTAQLCGKSSDRNPYLPNYKYEEYTTVLPKLQQQKIVKLPKLGSKVENDFSQN